MKHAGIGGRIRLAVVLSTFGDGIGGRPVHPEIKMRALFAPADLSDTDMFVWSAETYSSFNVLARLRLSKLRVHERAINSIPGDELLVLGRVRNFLAGHDFSSEVREVHGDMLRPFLSLRLQADSNISDDDKPTGTSLHEGALLALEDGTASSIGQRKANVLAGAMLPVTGLMLGQQPMAEKVQNRP